MIIISLSSYVFCFFFIDWAWFIYCYYPKVLFEGVCLLLYCLKVYVHYYSFLISIKKLSPYFMMELTNHNLSLHFLMEFTNYNLSLQWTSSKWISSNWTYCVYFSQLPLKKKHICIIIIFFQELCKFSQKRKSYYKSSFLFWD
jgi:hypothetical protein